MRKNSKKKIWENNLNFEIKVQAAKKVDILKNVRTLKKVKISRKKFKILKLKSKLSENLNLITHNVILTLKEKLCEKSQNGGKTT